MTYIDLCNGAASVRTDPDTVLTAYELDPGKYHLTALITGNRRLYSGPLPGQYDSWQSRCVYSLLRQFQTIFCFAVGLFTKNNLSTNLLKMKLCIRQLLLLFLVMESLVGEPFALIKLQDFCISSCCVIQNKARTARLNQLKCRIYDWCTEYVLICVFIMFWSVHICDLNTSVLCDLYTSAAARTYVLSVSQPAFTVY